MTKGRYMMATEARHKLGDISRDEPDLCLVHDEDEENYIGQWVEGLGFIGVIFPKKTTRPLTNEEMAQFNGKTITINGRPLYRMKVDE